VNGRSAPKPLIASFIAVHESEAGARDMFEKYIRNYARSALDHYEFHNEGLADIPGYEYYGKLAANIRKHGIDAFVNWLSELQVWGTPEQVYKKLVGQHSRADSGGLIGAFSYGGMPHDLAKRNIALFAECVLPRLQALRVSSEISAAPIGAAILSKLEIDVSLDLRVACNCGHGGVWLRPRARGASTAHRTSGDRRHHGNHRRRGGASRFGHARLRRRHAGDQHADR